MGMLGKHHSEYSKHKISMSNTGKKRTEELKLSMSIRRKGVGKSDLTRERMSIGSKKMYAENPGMHLGKNNPHYGKSHSYISRLADGILNNGIPKSIAYSGKGNPMAGHIRNDLIPCWCGKIHKTNRSTLTGKFIGSNNPNWKNGISKHPYPYKFNESLKNKIKIRDGYTCQCCGCISRRLVIHHINYVKIDIENSNLITLCSRCNNTVNSNRKYWSEYFRGIVIKCD